MKLKVLAMALISLVLFSAKAEEKQVPIIFPTKTPIRALATRPAQAVLVEPKPLAEISADSITLKWNSIPTADHYVIQVATDPNFKWPVAVEWNLKATSFEVKGLKKDQWYFWRVAGVKPDNNPGYTQGFYTSSSFEVH
jgi:hypothetical protein